MNVIRHQGASRLDSGKDGFSADLAVSGAIQAYPVPALSGVLSSPALSSDIRDCPALSGIVRRCPALPVNDRSCPALFGAVPCGPVLSDTDREVKEVGATEVAME